MSSLADLPDLIGFFSYSRGDEGSGRRLSALRTKIQTELSDQLGWDVPIWQDKEAIKHGELWEEKIKAAIAESVFFIPLMTPRAIRSPRCHDEFRWFHAREEELGRRDLMFPIHYIEIPELRDRTQRDRFPVLRIIAERQYFDWHIWRHKDAESPEIREAIAGFCKSIVAALQRPLRSDGRPKATPRKLALRILFEKRGFNPIFLPLDPGPCIDAELLGSRGAALGKGPLGVVEVSAHDPAAFAVRNTSRLPWRVVATGRIVELASGDAQRLTAGDEIDFGGGIRAVVEPG